MTLYGFFHTSCIYESAHALISLHTTKRGAWKAMQLHQWKAWEEVRSNDTALHLDRDIRRFLRERKAYTNEASFIGPVEVVDDSAI